MSTYSEYPQVPPPYAVQQTNSLAIVSLVAGIVSWVLLPVIASLVAVITGHMAKNQIRASGGMMTGDGLATAGLVLGYVNLALGVIGICLAVLAFAGVFTLPLCLIPFSNGFH